MDIYELVRKNVKRIREEKGLSQERVSELSGIAQSNISQLELGLKASKPTLQTLVRISKALDCELTDLFYAESDIEVHEALTPYLRKGKKGRDEAINRLRKHD